MHLVVTISSRLRHNRFSAGRIDSGALQAASSRSWFRRSEFSRLFSAIPYDCFATAVACGSL